MSLPKLGYNFKLYFQIDFTRLTYFGCWIHDDLNKHRFYPYYFFVINVLLTLLFNVLQIVNLCYVSENLMSVAYSGYMFAMCFMYNFRSYYILKNRRFFGKLLAALSLEVFQPNTSSQFEIITKMLKVYANVKMFLLMMGSTAVIGLILTPLFKDDDRALPVVSWYPFDISSPLMYTFAYTHQSISIFYIGAVNTCTDILFAGLSTFIALQCGLLCDNLRNLHKEGNSLSRCVEQHWKILEFAKTTEASFSQIYFGQFFACTMAYCMTLFLLTLVDRNSFAFLYLVVYQTATFSLLLVPCWFSTKITKESEAIPIAAYECNWIEQTNAFKKDLSFFMLMSQKPIKLLAINFFHISVETFVKSYNFSYAFLWVLIN